MRSCVVRSPLLDTFTAADLQRMDFPPINDIVPGYVVEGFTPVGRQAKARQVLAGTRLGARHGLWRNRMRIDRVRLGRRA
jgi:hypothetical protein